MGTLGLEELRDRRSRHGLAAGKWNSGKGKLKRSVEWRETVFKSMAVVFVSEWGKNDNHVRKPSC